MPQRRLRSLDAFRGLTIAAMVLVNNPGTWAAVYAPLTHARWHGLTPTDVIFPFFLFIVGVAIPLSRPTAGRVLRRAAVIFALGIVLNGLPRFDWATIRIPGVLQRIAVCYLIAALLFLTTGWRTQAIVTAVHNTPFGDIVDTEDDLQPLVFAMFRDATRAVTLVAAAMTTAEFDAPCLEARAADGWTTLTELADTLARDEGVPFKTAHAIAARLVAGRQRAPERSLADLLADASAELLGAPIRYSDEDLARILSPRHFVEVRRTFGGPAPEETARAAQASADELASDRAWLTAATGALAAAERMLAERAAAL